MTSPDVKQSARGKDAWSCSSTRGLTCTDTGKIKGHELPSYAVVAFYIEKNECIGKLYHLQHLICFCVLIKSASSPSLLAKYRHY